MCIPKFQDWYYCLYEVNFKQHGIEPCLRGSAQSPSPCGSGLCTFPSFHSPIPGCHPRIGCRECVEGVGGRLWWGFWWGKHCLDRDLLCDQHWNLKMDFYIHHKRRGRPAQKKPFCWVFLAACAAGAQVCTWVRKTWFCLFPNLHFG